jgi:predicted Fe-S protein YdhL (DUF1289 family)
MDAQNGCCEGCLRTLDELAWWSQMPDEAKREVWVLLEERRRQLHAPPSGMVAAP